MAFCSAFHVFSVLAFSLTGSFVELDNAAICPTTTEIGQKTTYVMKKCNSNIKEYYARNQNDNQRDTYCTGMKVNRTIPRVLASLCKYTNWNI